MPNMLSQQLKRNGIWIFVSLLCYGLFAYDLERTNFYRLLLLYTGLFVSFLSLVFLNKNNTKLLIILSFAFRAVLLFSIPNLSDDFFRFIWDGRLIFEGLNPYLYLPESEPNLVADGQQLYEGMGAMNGSHYTCYPPLNQFAFLMPALFFSKQFFASTITMRLILIAADVGVLYFGKKLLDLLKLPNYTLFLYLLNPFIILELTGNLHFEGLMLFLLAVALYYLFTNRWKLSAVFFSLSVSVKLIPLLFLPLFLKKLGLKKSVSYFTIVALLNLLYFAPFFSFSLLENFMSSIHLYFQNFEFNASFYYIIREIGYAIKGYNIIHSVGSVTPFLVFFAVLALSYFRKNTSFETLLSSMLFSIVIYYSLASVVHPWYIALPLFLSVFTGYRFPLVWSFFIMLSYAAYQEATYQENLYLVAIEYSVVYAVFIYEIMVGSIGYVQVKKSLA